MRLNFLTHRQLRRTNTRSRWHFQGRRKKKKKNAIARARARTHTHTHTHTHKIDTICVCELQRVLQRQLARPMTCNWNRTNIKRTAGNFVHESARASIPLPPLPSPWRVFIVYVLLSFLPSRLITCTTSSSDNPEIFRH